MSTLHIALVGNPNCGKTTLFNRLTGSKQTVGNWPGVTVERKQGRFLLAEQESLLTDLPGAYSLDLPVEEGAIDEQIARNFVLSDNADLVLNIIDASNLERSLYLTTQLLTMGKPMLVALNMTDVAASKGIEVNAQALSEQLGCPVVPISASKNQGMATLKQHIQAFSQRPELPFGMQWPEVLANAINQLRTDLQPINAQHNFPHEWLALRLLEGTAPKEVKVSKSLQQRLDSMNSQIKTELAEDLDIIIADAQYSHIGGICQIAISKTRDLKKDITKKIDRWVLNRWLAIPVFLTVMYLMFLFSINIGSAFIDFFDISAGALFVDGPTAWLGSIGFPEWLITIITSIGAGLQTVATFIPVIIFLYLFLSFLEDTGYLARAAFVIDKTLQAIGLPGKAFVPLLVGFGCNVPAITATRSLDRERDRLVTIMMAPFMSCGARLPVYALFAAALFPQNSQNVVFALYLTGIAMAMLTGFLLRKTLLPGQSSPMVMELPSYHMPNLSTIWIQCWKRSKSFLLGAGKTIVIVVAALNFVGSIGADGSFGNNDSENSILSVAGKAITPAFHPLGITDENWPATVGIFTGIFAKEAVVGTLDALYARTETNPEDAAEFSLVDTIAEAFATIPANLQDVMANLSDPLGMDLAASRELDDAAEAQEVTKGTFKEIQAVFPSAAAAFAYMLFILLYTPCVAALGAIQREAGKNWMLFSAAWTFTMAWIVSVGFYQISQISVQPIISMSWVAGLIVLSLAGLSMMKRWQINQQGA
ncbi:Fe(2+) transporter permease subunit FeoB [Pelagibaculum spongiae]|uniref:Ferrous iron transport protein B n=1 Tax=Pelagibaculum spongiae TaxID=2080658 RepID=A0A2V1GSI5_9GAMM|nr:Fe(2+) transporter permease subunit FeoB [Pelagibaculum spongiae]PVZ64351.1 ferrous iron transporter B [Pelagibaculum spongiae]